MRPSSLLLYDADCGFCRWALGWVLRWDRRRAVRPVALQEASAADLLPGMTEEQRLASWHLVTAEGEVRSAGAAAAPLLRLLPWGRGLAALFEASPGAVERAYAWTVRHRGMFGRRLSRPAIQRADALIADRRRLPSDQTGTSDVEEAIR